MRLCLHFDRERSLLRLSDRLSSCRLFKHSLNLHKLGLRRRFNLHKLFVFYRLGNRGSSTSTRRLLLGGDSLLSGSLHCFRRGFDLHERLALSLLLSAGFGLLGLLSILRGCRGGLLRCTMTYGVESQYSADFALRVAALATAPETP